jgi:hypothetical protein
MSSEQSTQPVVDDVADLEVHEADQIVGGNQDIHIIKHIDKASTTLVPAPVTPPVTGSPAATD